MTNKTIKYSSYGLIAFFVVMLFYDLFYSNTRELIFDRTFSIGMILLLLFLSKRMFITTPIFIFNVSTLILHGSKLYGNTYFGIAFDKIIHFYGAFGISLIIFNYLYTFNHRKKGIKMLEIIIISFGVAYGIASLVEVIEFVGYGLVGQGEGLLGYGTGDYGEWNNTAWDLISNALGAAFGIIVMFIKKKFK